MFYFKILDEDTLRYYKIGLVKDEQGNIDLFIMNEYFHNKKISTQQLFNALDKVWEELTNKDAE